MQCLNRIVFLKKILGISAYYHDAAACILVDGKIIAAAQEERFTRIKHDSSFPEHSVRYCLKAANIQLHEIDAIVFYDKPLLKFERLLETYYAYAPQGLSSFISAMPVWLSEKLFLKKHLREGLLKIGTYDKNKIALLFPEHHLSHAASAFYPSAYDEAAILTIDGVGEWTTASIGYGKGKSIQFLKEMHFPHSLGLFYSAVTYFLGFQVNSGEYKVMGLAPYGDPNAEQTKGFVKDLKKHLITINEDGSVWLNQKHYRYAVGLRMLRDKKWEKLLGIPKRKAESPLEQCHANLALAVQMVTEEAVLAMAKEAKKITQSENLCLAGGVALNCVANGKIAEAGIFKNIYVQPAAGDAGGALGAALCAQYLHFNQDRIIDKNCYDSMHGAYLGPAFSNTEVETMAKKFEAKASFYENRDLLNKKIAEFLSQGKVVGWFQDRMEFGPRALGNRSILGDPSDPEMQKTLNLKIKFRESFRPFAPSVLAEKAKEYFALSVDSPYMLMVSKIQAQHQSQYNPDYSLNFKKRLEQKRSTIQAVTHMDYSARVQTVHQETNPKYHNLIAAFEAINGTPILVNTSFNVRGEPLVCTPEDAYRCFMATAMDVLVIQDYVFIKSDQKDANQPEKWQQSFKLD